MAAAFERQMADVKRGELDGRRRALLGELARMAERLPNIEGELRGLAGAYRELGDEATAADLEAVAGEIRRRAEGVIEFGAGAGGPKAAPAAAR